MSKEYIYLGVVKLKGEDNYLSLSHNEESCRKELNYINSAANGLFTDARVEKIKISELKPKMHNQLGEYIYMGMGKCNGATVCLSVGYKLDYAVKKAIQFEKTSNGAVRLYKINKVKVGCLEAETSFSIDELVEYMK